DYSQASKIVSEIKKAVEERGDEALIEYTKKFDKKTLSPQDFHVTAEQINQAYENVDQELVDALRRAHANIEKYHKKQLKAINRNWSIEIIDGVEAGERITPIESVGCYVPGGRASYPSTVLMTVTCARIAKVKRIVVASPPEIDAPVLVAADIAQADEVIRIGGAQAIYSLTLGTETIKPVDKIVGPGNKYVTAAKMSVYGQVDVDMPAGPSEVLILSDESTNPVFAAADLLAQAEHDPLTQCILASTSRRKIGAVEKEVMKQKKQMDLPSQCLGNITSVYVESKDQLIEFANKYAPEHLLIMTADAQQTSEKAVNAGAVFIGPYSPVSAGDYACGPNHVLPTSGAARFKGQLSVRDFLKSQSTQKITKEGLMKLSPTITHISEAEKLIAHKRGVEKRFIDN
ncbi:MAG: histidinol dehydrogenase, partial [Candidatus Altiarchaeales archaeon]|nr:histidinol dehydrogenase [Candidatus Altiarchaeales archaeon]